MHLYFVPRGINHWVEVFKIMAQAQFFKWERINLETKKTEVLVVQAALRPSILGTWEYVFPEEALPEVLAMFKLTHADQIGAQPTFKNKFKLWTLRKMMGLKAIPKEAIEKAATLSPNITLNNSYRALSSVAIEGVAIHPIGIKYDEKRDSPDYGYYQERI